MHHYPFSVGDYAAHTQHLDEIEDLAYRRMLDFCYLHECGLPETVEEIARVIRMRTHCERIANVMREFFFQHSDGSWRNKRADAEVARYREKSGKATESARKRWKKCDANALRTQSEGNANQNQNQNQNHTFIADAIAPADSAEKLPVEIVYDSNGQPVYKYRGDDPRAQQPEKQKPTKGHRLPADWILPRGAVEWAMAEGFTRDQVLREAERFKDYWHSKPGREGTKTDWAATWRNWIRKAADDMSKRGTRPQSHTGATMFADLHADRSWADGLSFIEKHTDPTWRAGL